MDKDVTVILAQANKKSEIMKGEGDGEEIKYLQMRLAETHNSLLFIELCKLMKKRYLEEKPL